MRFCKWMIRRIWALGPWMYVKLLGWIFYEKKYLKGKWFSDGICSLGWIWAARDIHSRIHTLRNLDIKWPVSPDIIVGNNIEIDPDDINNMQGYGCYFQTIDGKIVIGKGSYIAVNVGIITTNHDINNIDDHVSGKDVIIGKKCWIGMNSVILPGVILGNNTVVGAGSVVTKSFPEGHCLIAGNPAKKIKDLEVSRG